MIKGAAKLIQEPNTKTCTKVLLNFRGFNINRKKMDREGAMALPAPY